MDTNTKTVVWTEGQLLTQQHLQWQDHWRAMQAAGQWQTAHARIFGCLSLQWDEQALYQHRLQLVRFQIILAEGSYYEYNFEQGIAPVFIDLHACKSPVILYLCLPSTYAVSGIPGYPEVDNAQWVTRCQSLPDRLDAGRSHELLVGQPNWKLSIEPLAHCHVLPVIRCVMDSLSGQWRVDEDFFYPVVALAACSALKTSVNRLMTRIEQYTQHTTRHLEASQTIWVTTTLYELQHGCEQHYPLERLYCLLAQILICLAFPVKPALGLYNPYQFHQSWQSLFAAWDHFLQRPAQEWNACVSLRQHSKMRWELDILVPEAFERAVWILVVESSTPFGEQLSKRFREETKIAAKAQVDRLAALALNGVVIQPLLRPDPTLYQRYKGDYFQLIQEGPAWESIRKERSLAILLSTPFQDLSLKLLVTHQSEVVA